MLDRTAATSNLRPGLWLEGYEILAPLGEGGMGVVWLARRDGRTVALKLLAPERADETARLMLLDEARVTSRLRHPNIAAVFDVVEGPRPLLAMEWVDGPSLTTIIAAARRRGEHVPPSVALALVAGAARGLHAAHELCDPDGVSLGLVHRDVSPSNVLVTREGIPKLIDFGVARSEGRLAGNTTTPSLKGKIAYMAPEQAARLRVDRRADVWGLTATLYALLSGHPPYLDDDDLQAAIAALLTRAPPLPLPPHVPADVRAIVARGLAHDPAERFATAAELATACDAARGDGGDRETLAWVERAMLPPDVDKVEGPAPNLSLATRDETAATERSFAAPPLALRSSPPTAETRRAPPSSPRAAGIAMVVVGAALVVAVWHVLREPEPAGYAASPAAPLAAPATAEPASSAPAATSAATSAPSADRRAPTDASGRAPGRTQRPRAPVPAKSARWAGIDDGF